MPHAIRSMVVYAFSDKFIQRRAGLVIKFDFRFSFIAYFIGSFGFSGSSNLIFYGYGVVNFFIFNFGFTLIAGVEGSGWIFLLYC